MEIYNPLNRTRRHDERTSKGHRGTRTRAHVQHRCDQAHTGFVCSQAGLHQEPAADGMDPRAVQVAGVSRKPSSPLQTSHRPRAVQRDRRPSPMGGTRENEMFTGMECLLVCGIEQDGYHKGHDYGPSQCLTKLSRIFLQKMDYVEFPYSRSIRDLGTMLAKLKACPPKASPPVKLLAQHDRHVAIQMPGHLGEVFVLSKDYVLNDWSPVRNQSYISKETGRSLSWMPAWKPRWRCCTA